MAEEPGHNSYLFTIRLWPESKLDGHVGWRGKVLGVTSGDSLYFRDWKTLLTFLRSQLRAEDSGEQTAAQGSDSLRWDGQ